MSDEARGLTYEDVIEGSALAGRGVGEGCVPCCVSGGAVDGEKGRGSELVDCDIASGGNAADDVAGVLLVVAEVVVMVVLLLVVVVPTVVVVLAVIIVLLALVLAGGNATRSPNGSIISGGDDELSDVCDMGRVGLKLSIAVPMKGDASIAW